MLREESSRKICGDFQTALPCSALVSHESEERRRRGFGFSAALFSTSPGEGRRPVKDDAPEGYSNQRLNLFKDFEHARNHRYDCRRKQQRFLYCAMVSHKSHAMHSRDFQKRFSRRENQAEILPQMTRMSADFLTGIEGISGDF